MVERYSHVSRVLSGVSRFQKDPKYRNKTHIFLVKLKKKIIFCQNKKNIFENLESGVGFQITQLESGVWIHTPLSTPDSLQ